MTLLGLLVTASQNGVGKRLADRVAEPGRGFDHLRIFFFHFGSLAQFTFVEPGEFEQR